MKREHVSFAALALAVLVGPSAWPAPDNSAPARSPQEDGGTVPVFGVESSLVLLDVVVRDKHDHLIRDLTAADFELLEDGQPQALSGLDVIDNDVDSAGEGSAQTIARAARARPGGSATPAAPGQDEPAVIAFVFDRLSTDARERAHKAALAYAHEVRARGDLVGVFAIDQTLRTLLPFSKDGGQLRAAFDRIATTTRTDPDAPQDPTGAEDAAAARSSSQGPSPSELVSALESELAAAEMRSRIDQTFEWLQRDEQGFASTNGLLALISGLKTLRGRKTIVFFAEGLLLSGNTQTQLESVVAAANRANVSIYAIEAGGLRVASGTDVARAALVQAGARRLEPLNRQAMSRPMMVELERSEDVLRLNPRSKLGELAESTGGFLVADTNDAHDAFRRLGEEMRFYYLLSYVPTNTERDGAFRRLSVKVKRSGVKVFSRSGYLALPPEKAASAALPVRSYEGPALSLLDRAPQVDDFALWARAMTFPEPGRRGRVSVLAGIPLEGITLTPDESRRSWHADLSVVARVRNERGQEIDRLSQHFPITIPDDKRDAARQGQVLFFRETDLRPGAYTLELIAYDSQGKQASLRRKSFAVGRVEEGALAVSSVAILQRVEPLSAREQGRDNPLYYGPSFMYPNLGQPLSKSHTPALGFYVTVYSPPGAEALDQATLEILKDGQSIAKTPTALAASDDRGRIQHAAAFPLDALAPGAYSLKVTVASGSQWASQQTPFMVTP